MFNFEKKNTKNFKKGRQHRIKNLINSFIPVQKVYTNLTANTKQRTVINKNRKP